MPSLHWFRFDDPGAGRFPPVRAWCGVLAAIALGGCSPSTPGSQPPEESLTSGRIQIVSAPEAIGLVGRQKAVFTALYPQSGIELRGGDSREAIRALFADEADLAVITRELAPEERSAAVRGGLELEGYRFARDAVVVVVHPDNPVENLALDDVRRIYQGRAKRWADMGGPDLAVVPVIQRVDADITAFFIDRVMGGEAFSAASASAPDDAGVLELVARDRAAIGYVSLGAGLAGVRSLRLASLTGLPYWKPDLEAVYRGDYPLTRYFNYYVRTAGAPLAKGFITFGTSREGQVSVQEAGFVPTTVPVRFVRRSPMMGTHQGEDR